MIGLVDVVVAIWFVVLRQRLALVLAQFVQRLGSGSDNEIETEWKLVSQVVPLGSRDWSLLHDDFIGAGRLVLDAVEHVGRALVE